jgi:histidinol dehydrogenase
MGKYEETIVREVVNAGSIFIGKYTAESFGDYASGTNHTLPTNGFARSYSGVSVDSFVKKITYQKVSEEGLQNLGPTVITMAEAEGLQGHANAVKVRLDSARQTFISMSNNERFIRPDLRDVKPYSSARDEFGGKGEVFLDANENGLLTAYNRYPDPLQSELKNAISSVKGIPQENLFLGNGSDEVLDLVLRLTSTPFIDSVAYLNPSYGMYTVLAKINGLETVEIALDRKFGISAAEIIRQAEGAKVLILCNPNNPTGAVLRKDALLEIVENFKGVVIVDEAYIDFCTEYSLAGKVNDYENLIVVQTLSKAYGMAGLRIGIAIASENWVKALNSIKPPYNLSSLVQETAIQQLESTNWPEVVSTILNEKEKVVKALESMEKVEEVFPSKANFVLFRIGNAGEVYQKLLSNGVVVRDRSTNYNCENTLRISIGNEKENDRFIEIMKEL